MGRGTRIFTVRVLRKFCSFIMQASKADTPTRFLAKRVWKLFYSGFLLDKVYLLFYEAGTQSGYRYPHFYLACYRGLGFFKSGIPAFILVYPLLITAL